MADVFPWSFTLMNVPAGYTGPTTLTLTGWQAPFGRPRKGAIVNAGTSVRRSLTYYPGKNVPPTVHVFGDEPKPFELHGRWMDFAMAQRGGAAALRATWRDFIGAHQVVRAAWGDMISYRIFLHDFDAQFESSAEIAWSLKADALLDETSAISVEATPAVTPLDFAAQLSILWLGATDPFKAVTGSTLGAMLSQLSDQLDNLIAQLNAPFAYIYNTCAALSSFESAVSSDIGKVLGGVSEMQTGLLTLRASTDQMTQGAFLLNSPDAVALSDLQGSSLFTGADLVTLTTAKQDSDAAIAGMLALLAYLQVQLAVVVRGQSGSAYVAQDGDTWESIASRQYGSADGAPALRAMNGIRYGTRPLAGKRYQVPAHP